MNFPGNALARLGLARAYAMNAAVSVPTVSGSRIEEDGTHEAPPQPDSPAKARAAYEDYLAIWKDADP